MKRRKPGRKSMPKPDGYQRTKTVYIRPEDWPAWSAAIDIADESEGRISLSEIVGRGIKRAVSDIIRRRGE